MLTMPYDIIPVHADLDMSTLQRRNNLHYKELRTVCVLSVIVANRSKLMTAGRLADFGTWNDAAVGVLGVTGETESLNGRHCGDGSQP
jgi:hypothetical protein